MAITERWSLVINKLGFIGEQPSNSNPFLSSHTGLTEIWLGPKWTFYRCEDSGTVAAFGTTFEIPLGSERLGQGTGDLSIVPYFSVAQNFGRSSYGSFNAMGVMGYAFTVTAARSQNFFTSLHLDYDVANMHKIYPLIELNWMQHTVNGNRLPFNFEGGDLGNFGSARVSGTGVVDLAFGARYKFSECVQLGSTLQFPLTGNKDLLDWRWTIDMIFRF